MPDTEVPTIAELTDRFIEIAKDWPGGAVTDPRDPFEIYVFVLESFGCDITTPDHPLNNDGDTERAVIEAARSRVDLPPEWFDTQLLRDKAGADEAERIISGETHWNLEHNAENGLYRFV